jgi:hypothetical protein
MESSLMMALLNVLILGLVVIWILNWDDGRPSRTTDDPWVLDLSAARRRLRRSHGRRLRAPDRARPSVSIRRAGRPSVTGIRPA